MKVVGVCPPVPNGCDLWRVAEPIDYLHTLGYDCAISLQGEPRHPIVVNGEIPDVLVVSRWGVAPGIGEKIVMAGLAKDAKAIIWDVDDDFWHLEEDNPYRLSNPPLEWMETMAARADLITTTTATLAEVIQRQIPSVPVRVVPNHIRLSRFAGVERVDGPPTVCLQGGHHERDWAWIAPILVRVLKDHPEATLRVIGDYPEWLREISPEQTEYAPFQPYLKWPRMLAGVDIGLAPLRPSRFNRGKSPIKWFEYSTVGAATIASPTVYGHLIEHGQTGLLAETPTEWEAHLRLLLNDHKYRRELATRAATVVAERHSLESRAEAVYPRVWQEAFQRWQHKQTSSGARKPRGGILSPRAGLVPSSPTPDVTREIRASLTPGPRG